MAAAPQQCLRSSTPATKPQALYTYTYTLQPTISIQQAAWVHFAAVILSTEYDHAQMIRNMLVETCLSIIHSNWSLNHHKWRLLSN